MSDESSKISRADFLKLLPAAAAGAYVGAKVHKEVIAPFFRKPPVNTNAELSAQKSPIKEYPCGISLIFDEDGLPKAYKLHDGSIVNLDKVVMAETRDKAITSQEKEIAYLFRLPPDREPIYFPTVDKPLTETLPQDIVDTEELKRRKLIIVNSPNVELNIRDGAFGKGELLSYFDGNNEFGLHIVLLDGPDVRLGYLDDPRYSPYRESLEDRRPAIDVDAYKQKEIEVAAHSIDFNRQHNPQFLFTSKLRQQIYKDLVHDEWKDLANTSNANPNRHAGEHLYKDGFDGNNSVVFMSVFHPKFINYGYITFDENGSPLVEREIFRVSVQGGENYPDPNDTHPDPSAYSRAPADSDYLYAENNPGHIASHELAHNQELQHNFEGEYGLSETNTDTRAAERMARAVQLWKDSGYTDDSLYYLVFSTAEGHILAGNTRAIS